MDYIIIIIIVVVAAALILGSYGRGKHEPKEVKPKGKAADENHKYIEVRATEDQLKDLIQDYAKQGWIFEDKQAKPNTSMFGSDIWQLSFHRITPEEEAAQAEQARADEARHAGVPAAQPLAAEPAPQPADEDPFGMEPARQAPDEDPFQEQTPADEDPFADIPLPQLPAPEADSPLQAHDTEKSRTEESAQTEQTDNAEPTDKD